ncbi:alpha/beta hydrolase [Shouchella lehensis]|uniref:Esterase n=1 Tax=Shouchella lehensis G1 TaxID=1246626 RepID=A0A060M1D7_9BACI|nr:alpha/beta hydrolase family protein [Shouchella lehensis]AIC96242.1 esterase [Shouchella lehensis G1]
MALIHMTVHATTIGKQIGIQLIVPDHATPPYRTLYLFHGWSDNETAWLRNTNVEQLANQYNLVICMPDVGLSYYNDMTYGGNYYSFIQDELPTTMEKHFSLSRKSEHRYVAGLSMGGFGAFKLALNEPERFRAAASFSGALLIEELVTLQEKNQDTERKPYMQAIFGLEQNVTQTKNDLLYKLDQVDKQAISLPLFQYCGTEDFLYPINQTFRQQAEMTSLPYQYIEGPGDHTWAYWNDCLTDWLKRLDDLELL